MRFDLAALACIGWIAGLAACVDVNGGAVELSWSLRTLAGDSVESCSAASIEAVRLCWQPLGDGGGEGGARCRSERFRSFPCEDESGATRFELPPGPTSLWIEPVCDDGLPAALGTYQVPPPIVRTVSTGDVVTLSSLLIAVDPCAEPGCTCRR